MAGNGKTDRQTDTHTDRHSLGSTVNFAMSLATLQNQKPKTKQKKGEITLQELAEAVSKGPLPEHSQQEPPCDSREAISRRRERGVLGNDLFSIHNIGSDNGCKSIVPFPDH